MITILSTIFANGGGSSPSGVEWLAIIGAFAVAVVALYAVLAWTRRTGGRVRLKIGPLEQVIGPVAEEVEEVRRRLTSADKEDRDEWEYRLLSEYHARGLTQSKMSFHFSILFAALGFLAITVAVGFAMTDENAPAAATAVPLVAGAIVEAVAGLFFVQSNRATMLMMKLFDRLRDERKLRDALDLAQSIENQRLRGRLQTQLALSMAGSNQTEGTLDLLLRPEEAGK